MATLQCNTNLVVFIHSDYLYAVYKILFSVSPIQALVRELQLIRTLSTCSASFARVMISKISLREIVIAFEPYLWLYDEINPS